MLAIEIPKGAAVVASSEHLEDAQGSAWAHCSANVNLTWALAGAASFSFCMLFVCNSRMGFRTECYLSEGL